MVIRHFRSPAPEVIEKLAATLPSKENEVGPEYIEAPVCRHQWVVESPNGPVSTGVCRLCGENRQFQNYIEGSSWGYDASPDQLSGGSRFPIKQGVRDAKALAEDQ